MKSTFVILMALASVATVEPCGTRLDGSPCDAPKPGSDYHLALSTMKQIKCEPESPTHDTSVFYMSYAKRGSRYNCAEIQKSDPEFNANFAYPPKPDSVEDLKGSHSYAHIDSDEPTINCFQSLDEMHEVFFSASKGFFPVIDLKNGINYVCTTSMSPTNTWGDRVARAFSNSCDDVGKEG